MAAKGSSTNSRSVEKKSNWGPPSHVHTVTQPSPIPALSQFKYVHLITGGISGAISRTFTSPLERLKILRQWGTPEYANIPLSRVFSLIYEREGLAGYFKGNGANIIRVVPFSGIEFYTFELVKAQLFEPGEPRNKKKLLTCGLVSGVTASTCTYPLDLIRTRLTINTKANVSMWATGYDVFRAEGARGLYKGWFATLAGIAPYVGCKMSFFDYFKPLVIPDPSSKMFTTSNMILGALAGTFAATLTYPTDLLRRKLQLRTKESPYNSVFGCVIHICKTEGPKGLYRGLVPCYLKVIPSCAIAFGCNEKLKQVLAINR